MTPYEKEAEELRETILHSAAHERTQATVAKIAAALERQAKESEIRGMEAAREITKACGKGQIFTAEAAGYRMAVRDEIRDALTVEIARMKGEEK